MAFVFTPIRACKKCYLTSLVCTSLVCTSLFYIWKNDLLLMFISKGLSCQVESSHPVDVLKRLVYTAAETNASEFLHMIFNSSAGGLVCDTFKDIFPLPEDTAKANGYDETAQYLRDVFQR